LAVPFAGTHELVAWCKSRSLKVGIVTNGRDAFQRSKIAGMGLDSAIDAIFTFCGYGVKKPDQAIFVAYLEQLGVSPARLPSSVTIYVLTWNPPSRLACYPSGKAAPSPGR